MVGKEEKEFFIPRALFALEGWIPNDLLPEHSSKAGSEAIALPDESPIAFGYYHYYIYHQDVAFPDIPSCDPEQPERKAKAAQYVHELCQTWIFGDKYNLPGLQNCAMFRLCEVLRDDLAPMLNREGVMSADTMKYCYSNTELGAKLRSLVADYVVQIQEHSDRQLESGTTPDLLNILSAYQGFTKDIYGALRAWYQDKARVPRYFKLMKHIKRYQVDVEDKSRVPKPSRAVWGRAQRFHCEHCGSDAANLFCVTDNISNVEESCACGKGDLIQLCYPCQDTV